MRCLAAVLTFYAVFALGKVGPAHAQHCSYPSRIIYNRPTVYRSYRAPVVVKKEVVIKEVPVITRYFAVALLADFPTYSAAYVESTGVAVQPIQPVQAPQTQVSDMQAVMSALKAIDARLQRLEQAQGNAPQAFKQKAPQEDKVPSVALVAKNKCAACHSEAKAADEGGGFVFIKDGLPVPLTQRQHDRLRAKCYDREMPPKNNKYKIEALTDAEVASLPDWPKKN